MTRLDSAAAARRRKYSALSWCSFAFGEMLIYSGQLFAMSFLRMVPDQNWLTERDHFELLAGGEMPPG